MVTSELTVYWTITELVLKYLFNVDLNLFDYYVIVVPDKNITQARRF